MKLSIIVGVAGHIDHGKTSLIKALNGFDGDSTQEEKNRGITLDLSFSNLLVGEKNISFIDVPGHHKLVKHMIAGAFGFDYLLLVVDPKEGIMPQTIEHSQIASFLGVKDIICVLSKKDQSSPDQRKQCSLEITSLLKQYALHSIALLEVSIFEPSSIQALLQTLHNLPPKAPKTQVFRYYIDRSFHIAGAGCVVSGTILGGSIKKKESIRSFDLNKDIEIKAITIHNQETQEAHSPTRAALNLVGVKSQDLKRGYLLGKKGYLRGFKVVDVWLEYYHEAPKHNRNITLHIGTRKTEVKVLWLNSPEETAHHSKGIFATLQSQENIFAIFDEPFILKDEEGVLAGGRILNPIADPMNKTQKLKLLYSLKQQDFPSAFNILLQAHKKGFGVISSFQRFALTQQESLKILQSIDHIFIDETNLIAFPSSQIAILKQEILKIFKKNPNALISAHSLNYKFAWASIALLECALKELQNSAHITQQDGLYLSTHHQIDDIYTYIQNSLYDAIKTSQYTPLAPYNLYDELDIDHTQGNIALKALCKAKKIIRLNNKLFITPQSLSTITAQLRAIITQKGYVDVNNAKELGLSRKYLIAYLEHLDHFNDIINLNQKRYLKDWHG